MTAGIAVPAPAQDLPVADTLAALNETVVADTLVVAHEPVAADTLATANELVVADTLAVAPKDTIIIDLVPIDSVALKEILENETIPVDSIAIGRPVVDSTVVDSFAVIDDLTVVDSISVVVDSISVPPVDTLTAERRREMVDSLVAAGESYRKNYEFALSSAAFAQAMELEQDSLKLVEIEDMKLCSDNGVSMAEFVFRPKVVAKHTFSVNDFFLYYPMQDRSWRAVPNVLDSSPGHPFAKAIYAPEESREIYYSAQDENGVRNIWKTTNKDSLWTIPALLNEHVTTSGDEVYPVVSPDGRTMYFASEGLYGVGGYDLYVSHWDEEEEDWGVPVNLGFPYSSPYDDVLLYNTPDGRYTIFASNRECPADSINVYVLEFDNMPIYSPAGNEDDLRELMQLTPAEVETTLPEREETNMPENVDINRYTSKVNEVKALRDSIFAYGVSLDADRKRLSLSEDPDERTRLEEDIVRKEAALPQMGDSLKRATAQLQDIEMEFLFNGVVIDMDKVSAEADREIVPKDISYTFVKMDMGEPLALDIEQPEPEFDYTFMILPEGRFAQDNTLPGGIVYQIQIFTLSRPATVSDIRGLSPVFLSRTPSGKYSYAVGLFQSYADALSHLNKVRTRGFREAYITAYKDGQSISVSSARRQE